MDVPQTLRLAGYALGAIAAALLFVESFQLPSYVDYDGEFGMYSLQINPDEASEYTWIGRIGYLLLGVAFTLLFVAGFV